MSLYNVEIFGREFNFKSDAVIEGGPYSYDYLALEATLIQLPVIECGRGDYISLADVDGNNKYWGYINSIEDLGDTLEISMYSLLGKLNVSSYKARMDLHDITVESFIGDMIRNTYINNQDELQNIEGLEINVQSNTYGNLNLKTDVHNIFDIAIRALKKYQIFVEFKVQISNKKVICNIRCATGTIPTIEADLENILNPSFEFKDTYEMLNKINIYGQYSEEDTRYGTTLITTYYMQPDGTITKLPIERITPVIWNTELIQIQSDFETEAYEVAYSRLYREELDNYISFEVVNNDNLVKVNNYEIGQIVNIIKNGIVYKSMFTGFELKKGTVRLLFGAIRTEYTKQLIMERRTA